VVGGRAGVLSVGQKLFLFANNLTFLIKKYRSPPPRARPEPNDTRYYDFRVTMYNTRLSDISIWSLLGIRKANDVRFDSPIK